MDLRNQILAGLLLVGVLLVTENSLAQLPDQATRIYTLLSGSQLTDDCPICDRMPIVVPLTGTFRLRLLNQTPLFTRYEIQNLLFQAGTQPGPEYRVAGGGIYEVGGEVTVAQDLFLDIQIDNGFTNTSAFCVNGDRAVKQLWPQIQVSAGQTNGTDAKVFSLTLIAAPALQFRAIIPDRKTGNVWLQWDSNGDKVQLERSQMVGGPYWPGSPISTNLSFTDLGALTNRTLFYRLRQY